MNINNIFKTVKPSMIKGAIIQDLLHDIQATAWQYAYDVTIKGRKLLKANAITHKQYNDVFIDEYVKALRVLKKGLK